MKKLLLAVTVAAFASSVTASDTGFSEISDITDAPVVSNVTKTFSGEISKPTCSIQAGDDDRIQFDTVLAPKFQSGEILPKKNFRIILENCARVDDLVSLHFHPAKDKVDNHLLKNTYGAEDYKANVKIKISVENGNQVLLGNEEGDQHIPKVNTNGNASGNPTFNFVAEYVKDEDTVTPGGVQAELPITISYK